MKPKFQPMPSSIRAAKKLNRSTPAMATAPAAARMIRPVAITFSTPKRAMIWPVKKDGAYIASTWPVTTLAGIGLGIAAADHGKRRRGHHQIHQRIRHGGDDDGDGNRGACGSVRSRLRPWSPPRAWRSGFGILRKANRNMPTEFSAIDGQVGAKKGHHHGVIGQLHQLRPDDGGKQPARHHPGNRLGPEGI